MACDKLKYELPLPKGSTKPPFADIQLCKRFQGFSLAELKRAAEGAMQDLGG